MKTTPKDHKLTPNPIDAKTANQNAKALAKELGISMEAVLDHACAHAQYLQTLVQEQDQIATDKRTASGTNLRHYLQLFLAVKIVALVLFEVIEISNFKPLLFLGWPAALFLGLLVLGIGSFALLENRKLCSLFIRHQRKRYGYIFLARKMMRFDSINCLVFDALSFDKPDKAFIIQEQPVSMRTFRRHRWVLVICTAIMVTALTYMGYTYTTSKLPNMHASVTPPSLTVDQKKKH